MADWCALSTERKQKIKKKYMLQDRHGALATSIFGMKGQNLLRIISSMRLRRSQSICPGLIRPSLRTTLKDNKTEQNPVRAEEPGFPHLSGTKKRILAREMLKSEILW
jgi:hypothetical protein